MGDVGEHFDRIEFRCKGHGRRGHKAHPTTIDQGTIVALERLRAMKGGRPLVILSGHRCGWWNRQQGGAPASRHLISDAADIPAGYATVAEAERAGFTGIGSRLGWAVHVDTRPRRARWRY